MRRHPPLEPKPSTTGGAAPAPLKTVARQRLGAILMTVWYIGGFVAMAAVAALDAAPFTAIEAAQFRLFGSYNKVVAMLPMFAVIMLPVVVVLGRNDWSLPLLAGARRALVGGVPLASPYRSLTRMAVGFGAASIPTLAAGLGASAWLRYGAAPPAPPIVQSLATVIASGSRPRNIRLIGAVVGDGRWTERYSVRQDHHVDVYRPLIPNQAAAGPVRLLLRDSFDPAYAPRPLPPALTGTIVSGPVSAWRIAALRDAGVPVGDDVIVLDHRDFSGGVPDDRWLDAVVPETVSVALAFTFAVIAWRCRVLCGTHLPDS